jgi:hypothetical protein
VWRAAAEPGNCEAARSVDQERIVDPFVVNNLVIPLAGMGTAIILGLGVLRVIRTGIERQRAGSAAQELEGAVRDLQQRVETLEQTEHHVAELEDRIDFAERLLAQQRESGRAIEGP